MLPKVVKEEGQPPLPQTPPPLHASYSTPMRDWAPRPMWSPRTFSCVPYLAVPMGCAWAWKEQPCVVCRVARMVCGAWSAVRSVLRNWMQQCSPPLILPLACLNLNHHAPPLANVGS